MAEKIGGVVSSGIMKMQKANMAPKIKQPKSNFSGKSKFGLGGGWFQQRVRHSNAKKFGKAGEPYASDKKKISDLTWDEIKNPQGDVDEDGVPNAIDCKPLDPDEDLSLAEIKEGAGKAYGAAKTGIGKVAGAAKAGVKKAVEKEEEIKVRLGKTIEKAKVATAGVREEIKKGGKIVEDAAGRTKRALQSLNPAYVQGEIERHEDSKEKVAELIEKLTEQRSYHLMRGRGKEADKITEKIYSLRDAIDKIDEHEKVLVKHKEQLEKGYEAVGEVRKEIGEVLSEEPSAERPSHMPKPTDFFGVGDEEPEPDGYTRLDKPKRVLRDPVSGLETELSECPSGNVDATEMERNFLEYYNECPDEAEKPIFSFEENLKKTNDKGNMFTKFIKEEKGEE